MGDQDRLHLCGAEVTQDVRGKQRGDLREKYNQAAHSRRTATLHDIQATVVLYSCVLPHICT